MVKSGPAGEPYDEEHDSEDNQSHATEDHHDDQDLGQPEAADGQHVAHGGDRSPGQAEAHRDAAEVSQVGLRGVAAHLQAYAVIGAVLAAGEPQKAGRAARAELEVLDRRSLLNVALVLAVEPPLILTPKSGRRAFRERLQRRHLNAMMEAE